MSAIDQDLNLLRSSLVEGKNLSEIKFQSTEITEIALKLYEHESKLSDVVKDQTRKIRSASVSLNKARLEKEQYKSSLNELQKILDLCRVISSSRDLKDILHHLLFLVSQILPSRGCAVFVGDIKNGTPSLPIGHAPLLSSNFTPTLQKVLVQHFEEGIIRWILKERRVCLIPSFDEGPKNDDVDGDFAVIPLNDNENNYGFIWIACTIRQEEVTPENTNLIWVLSSHASIAIINCLHRNQMEEKFNELKLLSSINSLKAEILRKGTPREASTENNIESNAASNVATKITGSLPTFYLEFHHLIVKEIKVKQSFLFLDGKDITENPIPLEEIQGIPFLDHAETRRLFRLAEQEQICLESGDFFYSSYPQLSKALAADGIALLSLSPPDGQPAYLLLTFSNEVLKGMPLLRNLLQAVASQVRIMAENMDLYDSLLLANRNLTALQWQLVNSGKMAALGQLAGGVAHEINNPLQIMLGRIQMIQLMSDSKIRDELQLVTEEILRIRDIVRNLLDFSRQGKRETAYAPVSLNDTLNEVLALLQHQLISNQVEIKLNLSHDPCRILGNKNQLKQVFINLLINAIHAMEKEPRLLQIESGPFNELFQISFCDSGSGISPENIQRIFDPFFSTKSAGTGLGLSISYGLIKDHKGTIEVESQEGRGTCFTLRLPKLSEEGLGYNLMIG